MLLKFRNIHRATPLFDTPTLQHKYFLVNNVKYLKTTFIEHCSSEDSLCIFSIGFALLSLIFFLSRLPIFLCTNFDSISSNLDEVLWINSSVNVFVFEDFLLVVCFVCLKEDTLETRENVFLFHFESSFRSWDSQVLTFHVFECHYVINV